MSLDLSRGLREAVLGKTTNTLKEETKKGVLVDAIAKVILFSIFILTRSRPLLPLNLM